MKRTRKGRISRKHSEPRGRSVLFSGGAGVALFLALLLLPLSAGASFSEGSFSFDPVREAWEEKEYSRGELFLEEMLSREGVSKTALYYDLGVFKEASGKTGEALLWYLRGAREEPRNRLLRQGIERTLPEGSELPLPWRLALWNRFLGCFFIAWLGLTFWFGFWIVLGLSLFTRKARFRLWARGLLLPALLFGGMALWNAGLEKFVPLGVLTEEEGVLRSGYSRNATPLYSLPEGSVLRILQCQDGFCLVQTSRGNRGWIPERQIRDIQKSADFAEETE